MFKKLFGRKRESEFSKLSLQEKKQTFAERFKALDDIVGDEEAMFSGSQMSDDIAKLIPLAQEIGEESEEMADILFLDAQVWRKRGEHELAYGAGSVSMRINTQLDRLKLADICNRSYFLGEDAVQIEDYESAVLQFELANRIVEEGVSELDPAQSVLVRSRYGFALHETGQFEDAIALNTQLITYIKKADNATDEDGIALLQVYNNLAQNYYEIGDFDNAKASLKERLALAQHHKDDAFIVDSFFQLGVISHEQNQPDQAEHYLTNMLNAATESGDEEQIELAQGYMDYWKSQ